jgi:hypothetical protein
MFAFSVRNSGRQQVLVEVQRHMAWVQALFSPLKASTAAIRAVTMIGGILTHLGF